MLTRTHGCSSTPGNYLVLRDARPCSQLT